MLHKGWQAAWNSYSCISVCCQISCWRITEEIIWANLYFCCCLLYSFTGDSMEEDGGDNFEHWQWQCFCCYGDNFEHWQCFCCCCQIPLMMWRLIMVTTLSTDSVSGAACCQVWLMKMNASQGMVWRLMMVTTLNTNTVIVFMLLLSNLTDECFTGDDSWWVWQLWVWIICCCC